MSSTNLANPTFDIHGLPCIANLEDLASHTNFSSRQLWWMLRLGSKNYRVFTVPKKSGGSREIACPSPTLMALQRWILRNILDKLRTTSSCYGFARGSKLKKHAEQHVGAKGILSLDLENFFPSISIARVTKVFRVAGYTPAAASLLARLCTRSGVLPQGAPTSPQLANLVCFRMDRRLARYAEKRGFVYTRYADDISLSAPSLSLLAKGKPFVTHIVRDSGFKLNPCKSHLAGPSRALTVTGLIVTSEKAGIGRQRLRELRARIHRVHTDVERAEVASLQGWLDFVSDVDFERYQMLVRYIARLRDGATGSPLNALRIRVAGP